MAALALKPAVCRTAALAYTWEACTRQFVAALAQPPSTAAALESTAAA